MLNPARWEEIEERVWRGKLVAHAVAHVLAGLGFGLLLYPVLRVPARALALVALTVSLAMHLSAVLSVLQRESFIERITSWRG
ncbi:MAG: hypothetical protein IRY83_00800 [Chloroflexi bacterium]|jgi:hypothetical protein|nr:hypothetical protein [Chloroflexota bacterium]